MNDHDSERMQGLLEGIGYAGGGQPRRRRPDPLQHLHDPRQRRRALPRQPGRRQAGQARAPGRGRGRRRLLGAEPEGAGLRAVPLRRHRLRSRRGVAPGRAGRARAARRRGRVQLRRRLQREPAGGARAAPPGVGADLGRLQLRLRLLHRADRPRPRAQPAAADVVAEVERAGRRRRARGHPARPERQLLRPRPAARASGRPSPSCCGRSPPSTGIWRVRYTSPHPKDMRADVIAAMAECPEVVRAPAPAGPVGQHAGPQGDAPHLRPRALPRPGRAPARRDPRPVADHRPHRRLPGRDRGRLRPDALAGARSAATTAPTRSSTRRGRAPRPHDAPARRRAARGQARAHRAAGGGGAAHRRRARRPLRRQTGEVLVEGPSRTDPSRLRGRLRQNIAVNFTGAAEPGTLAPRADRRRHVDHPERPRGRRRARRWPFPPEVLALAGPTAAGKSALAHAAARALGGRDRRGGPVPALPRARDRRRQPRARPRGPRCAITASATSR